MSQMAQSLSVLHFKNQDNIYINKPNTLYVIVKMNPTLYTSTNQMAQSVSVLHFKQIHNKHK